MNKSAAGFCKRMHGSMEAHYGIELADSVCGRGVGASATPAQKGRWAAETMERLAACLEEGAQAKVLAGCACGPGQAQMESARQTYGQCSSLQEYCDRRNEQMKGVARFETRDGLLYVSYPCCYCSMVKNAPNPVPKTWCLCSCEYTRRSCEHALGRPVEVALLKTVIGGDDECLFEVRLL